MMRFAGALLSLLTLLMAAQPVGASASRRVHVAVCEWPPFSTRNTESGGIVLALMREALATQGYVLDADVLPWKRAIDVAEHDTSVIGFGPTYDVDLLDGFFQTAAIASSPIGFAELKDKPIAWRDFSDLAPYRIGVTLGYRYTNDFDAALKKLDADVAPSDELSLRKLVAGRVDAVVIDYNAMLYLLDHDPVLRASKETIVFNPHILATKDISFTFRDTAEGHLVASALMEGLKHVDLSILRRVATPRTGENDLRDQH